MTVKRRGKQRSPLPPLSSLDMLIYLASPYTHPDPDVRAYRCDHVQSVCAELARRHIHVISPIAHWHPIQVKWPDLPPEFEFWEELDKKMIAACDEFWVLNMSGWIKSKGIKHELVWAQHLKKPCYLLEPDTLYRTPLL